MSTPTNVTIDNQLEYTYKEITLDTSANIVDYRIKIWGRELYYSEGDIDLNVSFVDKSRGSVTIQPLRRITFAEGKGFNEIIINSSTTTATSCKLIITSGDLIVQDYTAEVSGTSSVNITKIGGEDVTNNNNWLQVLEGESSGGTRKVGYTIINQSSSNTTVYTCPASTLFYLHGISHITNCSNATGGLTYFYIYDSGGSLVSALSVSQLTSTVGNNQAQVYTYSTPIKMVASESLQIVSNANVYQNITWYGYEYPA